MRKLLDPNHRPEDLGILPGELPIQPDSAALMVSFLLTLNILAGFLDYPPDALMVVDERGTIVLVNVRAETLFGYGHHELIGQPIERLLPEHLHPAHVAQRTDDLQHACSRPMGIGLDLLAQRKDGSPFPVAIRLRPIRIEQTLHVMAAIRDMTAQRDSERTHVRFPLVVGVSYTVRVHA